jgi:excisionase family DNA binding protein
MIHGEKLYKSREVCEMLNISYKTLLKWIRQGKIKAIRVNGYYRIPESELRKIISEL